MKIKNAVVAIALMAIFPVFAENEITEHTKSYTDTCAESQYTTRSPISYKVEKDRRLNDYSIHFWNNTRTLLEVHYVFKGSNGKWIDNYVRVPASGKNMNNAAGPYGQVDIVDVYQP